MQRIALAMAGLMGALAVAGAAAAQHVLADEPNRMQFILVASRFALLHAGVLVGIAALLRDDLAKAPRRCLGLAVLCYAGGFLGFCFGLWSQALGAPALFGRLIPIGGTLFIVGWLALAAAALVPRGKAP